jgi:Predicted pPIWI-associating nuclease
VADDRWQSLLARLGDVDRAIGRVTAVNVNTGTARDATRSLIQDYFRRVRPDLATLGFADSDLEALDGYMQRLLQLANGRNARASYLRVLRDIRRELQRTELIRELRLGEQRHGPVAAVLITDVEGRIVSTLEQLVPTAALSYQQALRDLADSTARLSFRGTANELREALRETLDHLAPDDDVMAATGFALEAGQTQPTQRQKVRHILRSRQLPSAARRVPEDTVALIEELTGAVARATSVRSSLSAHIASTEQEVRQLKMYVDSVLAELLQVHAVPEP